MRHSVWVLVRLGFSFWQICLTAKVAGEQLRVCNLCQLVLAHARNGEMVVHQDGGLLVQLWVSLLDRLHLEQLHHAQAHLPPRVWGQICLHMMRMRMRQQGYTPQARQVVRPAA